MTNAKRLTVAIKAEIAVLKNDVSILMRQEQQAGHDGEKAMYGQLLARANDRLALLTGLK